MKNKLEIFEARRQGYTYSSIARALNMSPDAVRMLCKRNGIEPVARNKRQQDCESLHACGYCGRLIINSNKQFCDRTCKDKYRNVQRFFEDDYEHIEAQSIDWYSFEMPCFNKNQDTLQEKLDSSIDWSINSDEAVFSKGGLANE